MMRRGPRPNTPETTHSMELRVKLTPCEHAKLTAIAEAKGWTLSHVFREWLSRTRK